ncbi:hypothetical protein BIY24_12710 [Halobacteriovorax marinus]|nr:hypothetical protein [Halobacteriovorax marinus]ATH08777.1 hypothetical protein BIY24_12710 [Halobacteriovorax marinus]
MASKLLTKYPILMVGLLLMALFLFQLRDKGIFQSRKESMTASSCKAVRVMLDKRIPSNWNSKCEGNNLALSINMMIEQSKYKSFENLRAIMYRELANDLILTAKNSPSDSLERTDIVRVRLNHDKLEINAITEGRFIVKLATIKSSQLIKEHLKATVQVKESKK